MVGRKNTGPILRSDRKRLQAIKIGVCAVCDEDLVSSDEWVMYADGRVHETCRNFLLLQKRLILDSVDPLD